MQQITITGSAGRDPELRNTPKGDQVCSLSVGVTQGWGENKSTNWFRCSIWGKRAETVAQYVKKGSKVTVCGEFSTKEYEGKTQLEIRVADIDWAKLEGTREQSNESGFAERRPQSQGRPSSFDDDSDSVPF